MRRWLWGIFYRLLSTGAAVRVTAWFLRLLGLIRPDLPGKVICVIESKLVYSGWPHHGPGWINLDCSRFLQRVIRQGVAMSPKQRLAWPGDQPRRIGLVG